MYDQLLAEQVASSRVPYVENPEQFYRMPDEYKELVVHQMMAHTEGSCRALTTISSCFTQ